MKKKKEQEKSLKSYISIEIKVNEIKNLDQLGKDLLEGILEQEYNPELAKRYQNPIMKYLSGEVDPYRSHIPVNISIIEALMRGNIQRIVQRLDFLLNTEEGLHYTMTARKVNSLIKQFNHLCNEGAKKERPKTDFEDFKRMQNQLLGNSKYIDYLAKALFGNPEFLKLLSLNIKGDADE